jgi:transcriptional regulator with XRE-family HTH domain
MENLIGTTDIVTEIAVNDKIIAKKLRDLRVRSCINLDEFAEALGVETFELESYENCSSAVPASVIAMVCALSGVPFEHFFGKEEESFSPALSGAKTAKEQALLLN